MRTGTESPRETVRVSRLQRLLEEHVFNPLFRWLLRSRLHWLISRWLMLVSYTGRRAGRRYLFPVVYAHRGAILVVVTPERESNWWRNFTEPSTCTVWYRGVERPATGELAIGDEKQRLLDAYVQAHNLVSRLLGVHGGPELRQKQLDELAVVQFHIDRAGG